MQYKAPRHPAPVGQPQGGESAQSTMIIKYSVSCYGSTDGRGFFYLYLGPNGFRLVVATGVILDSPRTVVVEHLVNPPILYLLTC